MSKEVKRSTCGICQIGCGLLVHSDGGRITGVEGDPENPLNEGTLCAKGMAALEYLYHPNRLKQPLKRMGERGANNWLPISWDEAIDTVARELDGIKARHGAEQVAFIRGSFKGDLTGDYLARFANVFGSPNILSMAHVCFMPRMQASRLTYGFFAIPDFDYPPAGIVLWGANPAESLHHVHYRILRALERGAELMVIDVAKPDGFEGVKLWLKPRPGTDLALALGMINVIINGRLYDQDFVEKWTVGFDQLTDHVREYTPERVARITWVPAETIIDAARFYTGHRPTGMQWGNAVDHGINNFQTARALCILRAITGNLEIPGGDIKWQPPQVLIHLTGRSSPDLSLPQLIKPEVRQRRVTTEDKMLPTNFYAVPQGIIKAMREGNPYPIRAAYVQGGNPLLTYSNSRAVYEAFLNLDFLAVADMFMTPTAALADIVLPVTSFLECDGIVSPPYSIPVSLVRQKVTRIAECRSDYEIIRDLAKKMGMGKYFWDTEEECLDFVLAPAGISFREFRKIAVLPGTREYRSYLSQGFSTPSKKVELYSSKLKEWGFNPLPAYHEPPDTPFSAPELSGEYPLVFTTKKRGCYRHSGGRQIVSLRSSYPEPVTEIHPETASSLGISGGDWVRIETRLGSMKQKAKFNPDIDPRIIVVDYGWWFPEDNPASQYGWRKSNVNMLTDDQPPFGHEMATPNFRGIMCRVSKVLP